MAPNFSPLPFPWIPRHAFPTLEAREHQLVRSGNGWSCSACDRTWAGRPRTLNCPGLKNYVSGECYVAPHGYVHPNEMEQLNLFPVSVESPDLWLTNSQFTIWQPAYKLTSCIPREPLLPPIVPRLYGSKALFEGNFVEVYTAGRLKEKTGKGAPEGCRPAAVYLWSDNGRRYWFPLYAESQATADPDNYLYKTTLKKVYHLSEKWLKRLGAPDMIVDNPYAPRSSSSLYRRRRVEAFLHEHAEEYSNWLVERQKLVVRGLQCIEHLLNWQAQKQERKTEQRKQELLLAKQT
ncbi:MAG TPA: hypothetical protein V6D29_13740, partial [Leptolyngbyaceae cyanobacterium]